MMRAIVVALLLLPATATLAFDVAVVGNDGPCSPVLPNTTRFLRWVDAQSNTSSGQMYVVAATPGGWTAAFGHVALGDIPTMSELALFLLAGALALLPLTKL
jgi:hypothetical protein